MGNRLLILTDHPEKAHAFVESLVGTFDAAFAISDVTLAQELMGGVLQPTAVLSDPLVGGHCTIELFEEAPLPADCRWILRGEDMDEDEVARALRAGALAVLDEAVPRELLIHMLTSGPVTVH